MSSYYEGDQVWVRLGSAEALERAGFHTGLADRLANKVMPAAVYEKYFENGYEYLTLEVMAPAFPEPTRDGDWYGYFVEVPAIGTLLGKQTEPISDPQIWQCVAEHLFEVADLVLTRQLAEPTRAIARAMDLYLRVKAAVNAPKVIDADGERKIEIDL